MPNDALTSLATRTSDMIETEFRAPECTCNSDDSYARVPPGAFHDALLSCVFYDSSGLIGSGGYRVFAEVGVSRMVKLIRRSHRR